MAQGVVEAAKRCELQRLQKNKNMMSELSSLEMILNDVIESQLPSPQDYENRRNVIRLFNEIAQELYGNGNECPVVKEFGFYLMDMFNTKSDLDLSINFSNKADRVLQVKTLRKFIKKLHVLQRSRHVSDIQLILSARVPVVKVIHCETEVECDLSVGNSDGIVKSQILLRIGAIDERFKKLSLLMKAWAKAHGINSAKDGTMNSLSLALLAAFHLQTRDTPILPPFSAILKDGVENFADYGETNSESLAELFVSLLLKLESVEPLWAQGLCASTYEGSWLNKKLGCIAIEDFIDRSQNVSRALKPKNKGQIYSCIHRSIEYIRLFTKAKVDVNELKNLLFGAHPFALSKAAKKRKRKQQGQTDTPQSKRKPGNPDERRRANNITPSVRGQVGRNNVVSTSYGSTSQGSWGFRPEGTLVDAVGQLASLLNFSIQGSHGLGQERTPVETLSLGAPNGLASRPITFPMPSQSVRGFGPQRSYVEHFNYVGPYFSGGQPLAYPELAIQEFGSFRPERTYVDTSRQGPNFPAPDTYSLASGSAGVVPPHQPYLPLPSSHGHMGLGWSQGPPRYFPSVATQYGEGSHAFDNRGASGHRRYPQQGHPSSRPKHYY